MRLDHVKFRIEQQLIISESLSRAVDQLHRGGAPTRQRLEVRLQMVRDQWEEFQIAHRAISLAISKLSQSDQQLVSQHSYFAENVYAETQECYLETVATLTTMFDESRQSSGITTPTRTPSQATTLTSVVHAPRLPRIDLPKFDGSLSEWLSFKDLFSSLVLSNPSISSVERLQYLKTSLVGSASHLLKNIPLTADNFQKAWDSVTSFYENERLLVHSTLHSLFSIRKVSKESASELENLYTSVMQIYQSLETLKRPVHSWDDILVYMMTQRLDSDSIRAWEQHLGSAKSPATFKQFQEFLLTRMLSLQAFERSQSGKSSAHSRSSAVRSLSINAKPDTTRKIPSCFVCTEEHYLYQCPKYQEKTFKQRSDFVSSHGLCFNCLGRHRVANCKSTRRCMKCGKRHHSSLHQNQSKAEKSLTKDSKPTGPEEISPNGTHSLAAIDNSLKSVNHSFVTPSICSPITLLATAQALILNRENETYPVRLLLDQGSEVSLITEKLSQSLRLPRKASLVRLVGIGEKCASKTRGLVTFQLKPLFNSRTIVSVTAHVLCKLTQHVPSALICKTDWPHIKELRLADPSFAHPAPIDIIIGADLYGHIVDGTIIRGPPNTPSAQKSKFGWILFGPTNHASSNNDSYTYQCSADSELQDLLERFWKQEEIQSSRSSDLTPSDQSCEEHFNNTHSRDSHGRYVVRLPFKLSTDLLGLSERSALQMLNRVQQKFQRDPVYEKAYSAFISEYETLGHMHLVPTAQSEPERTFYLPHHGVIRESSTTTKLRVVFNGSCKTTSGMSLNDILHSGPKLQTDLFDVLVWIRHYRFMYASDIEKMYRQITIHPEDRVFQRILWMQNQQLIRYELSTVTYGLACAPYLALKCMQQLVQDEGSKYPLATDVMSKGRYVDDIFGGADTIEEAQIQAQEVDQICKAGGFPLRKWISNHPDIVDFIPPNHRATTTSVSIQEPVVHALGLSWNVVDDTLSFSPLKPLNTPVTKRTVLSKIAQLFDPLGFLSPLTIRPKVFMQELWGIKISWDQQLPEVQLRSWSQILQSMDGLETIKIPRWIGISKGDTIELHGFSDASQTAMAAAVFIRTSKPTGEVTSALICSKTKVAPLKRLTIPRLELSAAVMLTKLTVRVQNLLNLQDVQCYLWTDSSIVHTWINNHPSKWKEIVHNRVCLIQTSLPNAMWKHIPGKSNPADCASRGLPVEGLKNHQIWWYGPSWLVEDSSKWPDKFPATDIPQSLLEERKQPSVISLVTTCQTPTWDLVLRYSSFKKLVRITAICRRVILRMKKTAHSSMRHVLEPEELAESQQFWIRITQENYFRAELKLVRTGSGLPKSNPLARLSPIIDTCGLLRVRGRLENSLLNEAAKHPYILPRDSPLTKLIIQEAHEKTLHGSTQDTLTYIRNSYWILGGRIPVRSHILKCVKCTRHRRARAQQLMGQLPPSRVNPSRAFLHSGLDYAGPFTTKSWKGRGAKTHSSWVALFVCLSTSAIHLELVSDYSTDAFLAAYKRFTARRGICATITSDCGTNFKGADRTLRKHFQELTDQLGPIAPAIVNDGTKWIFNPPAAPHFGGKWEAGVKSMKYHLKRIANNEILTQEEMTTLLAKIEAILNSRPLCGLSDDPDDLDVLTPAHFLIGQPLTLIPEPNLLLTRISHLTRWQRISQMLQSFWAKWQKDYLQRFQIMQKWNNPGQPIAIGNLVLIIDERYPSGKWSLGRVTQVHPGSDGVVRVATIKTGTTYLKRPIVKLCPLPIETNPADHSMS